MIIIITILQKIIENGYEKIEYQECFPKVFGEFKLNDCIKCVKILHNFSNKLGLERSEKGFLCNFRPELRFLLDPVTKRPKSLLLYVAKEANQ